MASARANKHTFIEMVSFTIFALQGSANPRAPGLVNFFTAVAYHLWPNLPIAFSQPGARGLADPCNI